MTALWISIKTVVKTFFPHILSTLAIVGLLYWYTDQQYKAGEQAATDRFDKMQAQTKVQQEEMSEYVDKAIGDIMANTNDRLSHLDARGTNTETTIIKEIESDPKQSDPDEGISEGMLAALNDAIKETYK